MPTVDPTARDKSRRSSTRRPRRGAVAWVGEAGARSAPRADGNPPVTPTVKTSHLQVGGASGGAQAPNPRDQPTRGEPAPVHRRRSARGWSARGVAREPGLNREKVGDASDVRRPARQKISIPPAGSPASTRQVPTHPPDPGPDETARPATNAPVDPTRRFVPGSIRAAESAWPVESPVATPGCPCRTESNPVHSTSRS